IMAEENAAPAQVQPAPLEMLTDEVRARQAAALLALHDDPHYTAPVEPYKGDIPIEVSILYRKLELEFTLWMNNPCDGIVKINGTDYRFKLMQYLPWEEVMYK